MSTENVIETFGLTRYFGRKCAVDQVSLTVPRGSVFALLGRNGSGKSTLMQLLLGLIEPTRGSATVLGNDCRNLFTSVRGRISYVPEGHPLLGYMRVDGIRAYQKSFYSRWNEKLFHTMVEHFGIASSARISTLSRGQKAGLALGLAIAPQPELLMMDDPALGLDPVARRTLLEAMILTTRDSGNTIFFTSHELADVERVADHIAIMDRSALRVCCSLDTLRSRVKRYIVTLDARSRPDLSALPNLLLATRRASELEVVVVDHDQTLPRLRGIVGERIDEAPVTLEDIAVGYLSEKRIQTPLLSAAGQEVG